MTSTANLTRRAMGALTLGGLAASCAPSANTEFPAPRNRRFPTDFLWCVATSAYQIEGARAAGGRGPSIWDVFPSEKVADRLSAEIACDSFNRFDEDAALIAEAGLRVHRFSIAWPRVFPEGAGALNEAGLDYYARVADSLLARGVAPYATLFHWDLPQKLQEAGGWRNRDTARRFADYAGVVARRLGDRIKHFIVMNEPSVHVVLGHVLGVHAPGLQDASLIGPATHHLNLAQGLACQALRAAGQFAVGTTLALMPSRPAPGLFLNAPAADGFDELWNGAYLDPLFKGAYPKTALGMVEPSIETGDLDAIRQPLDFLGVNYYAPAYMRFNLLSKAHVEAGRPPKGAALDAFGRHVDPSGLWRMLARLRDDYGNPRVIITENGCSDPLTDDPAVLDDRFRIDYLRAHLEAVLSAIEAGSPIEGYFHWTLVDNWEWAEGYRSKFGLVAMDRASGARTPKASYAWMSALAASGELDRAISTG